jgi:hypothetical protein
VLLVYIGRFLMSITRFSEEKILPRIYTNSTNNTNEESLASCPSASMLMGKLWRNPLTSPAHLLRKCAGLYSGEFHKMFSHRHLALGQAERLSLFVFIWMMFSQLAACLPAGERKDNGKTSGALRRSGFPIQRLIL